MATKLQDPPEDDTDTGVNDDTETQTEARDFEAEALAKGWRPESEFKGDPAKFIDAETFLANADTLMPLLKQANKRMERELADLRKQTRRVTEQFTRAEERRQREIDGEIAVAVEAGDGAAVKALRAEEKELANKQGKPEYTKAEATEAFNNWRDENPWYDRGLKVAAASETEQSAALYAERMTEVHMGDTASMSPEEFFGMIGDLVKEKYPTVGTKAPRAKPASDVAGATHGRAPRQNGKGFNDLPVEAQRAAEKWIKQGLIKDRAAYLASYDWS